jgi:hypothetical protein
MRNFNLRSLILEIGIGLILASILGMLYYAGITASTGKTSDSVRNSQNLK